MRPEIVAKWMANAPLEMLEQYAPNLKCTTRSPSRSAPKDTLLASNRQLHEAMTRLRIPHGYEEYDGDHTNKVGERIEAKRAAVLLEEPRVAGEPHVPGGPIGNLLHRDQWVSRYASRQQAHSGKDDDVSHLCERFLIHAHWNEPQPAVVWPARRGLRRLRPIRVVRCHDIDSTSRRLAESNCDRRTSTSG